MSSWAPLAALLALGLLVLQGWSALDLPGLGLDRWIFCG